MVDHKSFASIPNCLDVEGQDLPIIVTGRRPTSWKCGEIGHLSSYCPEKKDSGVPAPADPNPPLAESVVSISPVMGMPETRTSMVKLPVG